MTKPTLSLLTALLVGFVSSAACSDKADVIGGPRTDAGASGLGTGGGGAGNGGAGSGGAGSGGAGSGGAGTGGAGTGGSGTGGEDAGAGGSLPGTDGSVEMPVASPDASNPAQFPMRVVFFYTPLGTVLESWRPATPFALTGILKPLEPFKDRLLVIDGIDNLARPGVPTTDVNGPNLLLTGRASGSSLGQLLMAKSAGSVMFGSVHLGVQSLVAIDYSPAPIPASNSPGTMARTLFGGHPMSAQIIAPFANTDDFAAAGRQQMDLVRAVLQYDRTRVISLSWGDVHGDTLFTWVPGVNKDYRTLATNSGAPGLDRDHFIAAQTWYAQQFAYLVNLLATTPEGAGSSLLDHTLLVWVSESGEASVRTGRNIPVVLAGNMLGRFRSGEYVRTIGSQANLLATIASVAGAGAFGDPALGNTPIAGLLKP